jgi:UvrD/REP helicase N-terminal domain
MDANRGPQVSGGEAAPGTLRRMLPSSVSERLDHLAPDQRAAATAPPGPVLCVAPAGSGKTTTLVARIAWLVATGADPAVITAVTFNKRAADEMASRVDAALEPLGLAPGSVRVKTFHALGREILADGGESVEPLLDREAVLRDIWPDITRGALRALDDAFSRLKLEIGVTPPKSPQTPSPAPSPAPSSHTSRPWTTPAASTSTTSWHGRFGCTK